jgi:hypothetical protein
MTPSWYGDSIGRYEGDVLVIDTVGIKADRPLAMVDQFGTPYTTALHVVERYRLIDYEAAKEALERDAKENFQLSRLAAVADACPYSWDRAGRDWDRQINSSSRARQYIGAQKSGLFARGTAAYWCELWFSAQTNSGHSVAPRQLNPGR